VDGVNVKTLIIDNYDSFTYNLVHLFAEVCGCLPVVVRNDEVTWPELEQQAFDCIVISPGPGHPGRAADFGVSRDAILHSRVPLLGVCLGHQGIAALAGGSVVRAPMPMHGRVSEIFHSGLDIFAGLPSPFPAARYHSLHVCRPVPPTLVETAWTSDGILMGLAHRERPQWAVSRTPAMGGPVSSRVDHDEPRPAARGELL
jgi:para-aminobenzoate synthetase